MSISKQAKQAGLAISISLMLFIIPFMNRPWLSNIWQFPNEGVDFVLHTNIVNNNNRDADDLTVAVYVYGLDIFQKSDRFDMDEHSAAGRTMHIEIPENAEGEYLARITLSNDDFREVKHRYITIA